MNMKFSHHSFINPLCILETVQLSDIRKFYARIVLLCKVRKKYFSALSTGFPDTNNFLNQEGNVLSQI